MDEDNQTEKLFVRLNMYGTRQRKTDYLLIMSTSKCFKMNSVGNNKGTGSANEWIAGNVCFSVSFHASQWYIKALYENWVMIRDIVPDSTPEDIKAANRFCM